MSSTGDEKAKGPRPLKEEPQINLNFDYGQRKNHHQNWQGKNRNQILTEALERESNLPLTWDSATKIGKKMEETKKTGRGGYRRGAGRPRVSTDEKKVTLSVTLPPETKEKVIKAARNAGMPLSAYITKVLEGLG